MISGKQLLPILIGAALGTGGWMLGIQRGTSGSRAFADSLEDQLRIAHEETAMLEKENQSLRSLAQGGGEVSVPPELIAQVEKDYGLSFLANPVFHQVASEELGYRIEAAIESRMGPQGIDDRDEAYKRLGWLSENDKLLDLLVAVKSVGAIGWFDEGSGDAWVTDKFDLKNVPDQAAMVRLLVRILLEQNFPAPSAYPGDDAARAREALHAGAASGAEARFFAMNAKAIGFVPLNDNSAAARLLLTLPDFIQGITMFPALEGKGLADTLFVRGTREFAEGLRNPPDHTLGVVLPAEKREFKKLQFDEISDEIYLQESAGYLGLRLWIAEMGDLGVAEEIARDWSGDRYALFADGETSTGVYWKIELETEKATDLLENAALVRVSAMVGLEETAEKGVVYEFGERLLGVTRISPTSIAFGNLATKGSAVKLLTH